MKQQAYEFIIIALFAIALVAIVLTADAAPVTIKPANEQSTELVDIAMRSPQGNILYLKCAVDKTEAAQ